MQRSLIVIGLVSLVGACGAGANPHGPDPARELAAEAAREFREGPAEEPAEAEAEAPPAASSLTVADLLAAPAAHADQTVTASGVYVDHTADPNLSKATIAATADDGAATLSCTTTDPSPFEGREPGSAIRVQGVVIVIEDAVTLVSCTVAPDEPADAIE